LIETISTQCSSFGFCCTVTAVPMSHSQYKCWEQSRSQFSGSQHTGDILVINPTGSLPMSFARPTLTFPARQHHHPSFGS